MEIICSLREQIIYFKCSPQIRSDTVSTIKLKNKNYFFICKRVWKTAKSQGILRWMISGNPGKSGHCCSKHHLVVLTGFAQTLKSP